MHNLDENHKTKTAHVTVIDFEDILKSINELQDSVNLIQTALNTIDTSSTSEFGRQLTLFNTALNTVIVSNSHIEARLALLETKVSSLNAPVQPIEVKPSFISMIISKFTNTWK